MNDDRVDAHWTAEELSLLGTAEQDRPPEGAMEQTLSALGMGAAVGAAGGALAAGATRAAATSQAGGLWLKALTLLLVGGAAVGGIAFALSGVTDAPSAKPVVPASSAPVPAVEPERALPAPVAEAVPSASVPVVEAPAVPVAAKPSASARRPLSEEIRVIDEARGLLRAGNPGGALEALGRYDALVSGRGSMRAEATVVRIEALRATGDKAGAAALGQRFLSSNPRSPYADYVRRLLD